MKMEDPRGQREIAKWQQHSRKMKYYLGYYGWIPAVFAVVAALVDVTGYLPTVVGKVITFFVAVLSMIALFLQKPEKDQFTKLSESMHGHSPSFFACVWYLSINGVRYRILPRMKRWTHRN